MEVTEAGNKISLEERGINKELSKSQEIVKDKERNFDGELHTDLLNEEVRNKFVDDFRRTVELPVSVAKGVIYHNKTEGTELLKSVSGAVRDLNIEVAFKDKRLKDEYSQRLEATKVNGKLTDESLKEVAKLALGVLAEKGKRDARIVFTNSSKLEGSVAKTDGKTFIIDLNSIDVSNYDEVVELMQYEGQRFNYADKKIDDVAVHQGVKLSKELGKTSITEESELLKAGNEIVEGLDLGEFRDNLVAIHGGNDATKDSVDGPLIAFGKNITKESLDFKYNELKQIYTKKGVELISKYKHKKGEPVILWGHSLGADSVLEAYANGYTEIKTLNKGVYKYPKKYNPQKAEELNIVMPRVSFIEKYIEKVSKNSKKVNIFILKEDFIPFFYYENRSYEKLMKKINKGELKIPKNVNIIPLEAVKGVKKNNFFNSFSYASDNHGAALKNGDLMFEQIKKNMRS